MKEFIARFKKAWAAFVRTWKFEKDAGEMMKRVREEVEYAIDCERNNAIEENDYTFLDYAVECYRSALRTYETMAADGHSGMSWSLTRQILNRLMEGKPLKGLNSYPDRPEEWVERSHWIVDDSAVLNNIRYPALSYRVNASGKAIYHDIDRWVFEAPNHPDIPWHNGFLSNYLDEKFPIQFPYNPITIHVRVEEILTDLLPLAIGRALDDILFWNRLAEIYLNADLEYDCRKYLSMAEDILEGITGRSDKTPFYIPRGSAPN